LNENDQVFIPLDTDVKQNDHWCKHNKHTGILLSDERQVQGHNDIHVHVHVYTL
jgi:hypothetical protein